MLMDKPKWKAMLLMTSENSKQSLISFTENPFCLQQIKKFLNSIFVMIYAAEPEAVQYQIFSIQKKNSI